MSTPCLPHCLVVTIVPIANIYLNASVNETFTDSLRVKVQSIRRIDFRSLGQALAQCTGQINVDVQIEM